MSSGSVSHRPPRSSSELHELPDGPEDLVEHLKVGKPGKPNHWNSGPHVQFGVTNVLCEGSGQWTSKQRSLDAGVVLMKSIAEYYKGTRPAKP